MAAGRCKAPQFHFGDRTMKLLRYGPAGQEKPGLLDAGGTIRDLSAVVGDIGGAALSPGAPAKLRAIYPASLPAVSGKPRPGPFVAGVSKFICIGLNYSDPAAQTGNPIRSETTLLKSSP